MTTTGVEAQVQAGARAGGIGGGNLGRGGGMRGGGGGHDGGIAGGHHHGGLGGGGLAAGQRGGFGRGAIGGGGFGQNPGGIGNAGINPGRVVNPGLPGRPAGVADNGALGGRPGWNRPGRSGWHGHGGHHHHHHGWRGRYYPVYGFGGGLGYGNSYYDDGYVPAGYGGEETAPAGDEQAAYCAKRFKTYDPRTGTYIAKGGKRRSCP